MQTDELDKMASRETPDSEREAYALKFGLHVLACQLDGLSEDEDYLLSEFSEENHYAHLLFRGVREDDLGTTRL